MLDSETIMIILAIMNLALGIFVFMLKRIIRLQDEKMTASITSITETRKKMHELELHVATHYATKADMHAMRTEINDNFQEVQRDLKTILRNLGVRDVA